MRHETNSDRGAMLSMLATFAQARPIDWQAELDRCVALREQVPPLLLVGKDISSRALTPRCAAAFGPNAARFETWCPLSHEPGIVVKFKG
jgi:hypothetical protein